jgi:pimeloyl-ACP methyl ester carboxylesterase
MVLVSNQYDFTTPILAKSCKVINYDVRGVGKSAPLPTLNYRDYSEQAEDVKGIIDAIGLKKIHIWAGACAHIGVRFAARYPERTASLILFPWFRQTSSMVHFFGAAVELCEAFGTLEQWAKTIVSGYKDTRIQKRLQDWEVPKFVNNISCETFKIHWNSMKNCDLSGEIPKIKAPTLIIAGTEATGSRKNEEEEIKYLEDHIREVEKIFIEGSGKTYYMVDNPEKTCTVIIDWLKRHPIK